jgi:hypothetical protein
VSKYLRELRITVDFEGDTVTAVMKPLRYEDFLLLQALIEGTGRKPLEDMTEEERDAQSKNDMQLVTKYAEILPRYVLRLDGMADAAGASLTIQEVCEVVYFMPLVGQLGSALIQSATPSNPGRPTSA